MCCDVFSLFFYLFLEPSKLLISSSFLFSKWICHLTNSLFCWVEQRQTTSCLLLNTNVLTLSLAQHNNWQQWETASLALHKGNKTTKLTGSNVLPALPSKTQMQHAEGWTRSYRSACLLLGTRDNTTWIAPWTTHHLQPPSALSQGWNQNGFRSTHIPAQTVTTFCRSAICYFLAWDCNYPCGKICCLCAKNGRTMERKRNVQTGPERRGAVAFLNIFRQGI